MSFFARWVFDHDGKIPRGVVPFCELSSRGQRRRTRSGSAATARISAAIRSRSSTGMPRDPKKKPAKTLEREFRITRFGRPSEPQARVGARLLFRDGDEI